jgi:hypothetical protein
MLYSMARDRHLARRLLFIDARVGPPTTDAGRGRRRGHGRPRTAASARPAQRSDSFKTIRRYVRRDLERLTTDPSNVDFLFVTYEVGGARACPRFSATGARNGATSSGHAADTVGFDDYVLGRVTRLPSIWTHMHRLANDGPGPKGLGLSRRARPTPEPVDSTFNAAAHFARSRTSHEETEMHHVAPVDRSPD